MNWSQRRHGAAGIFQPAADMTVYFDKPGPQNTAKVAELVEARARELGVRHVVVASNTGFTARHFKGNDFHVVVVTHHVGFKEPGIDEMGPNVREELRREGMDLLTQTHLFGNVERAVTSKYGGLYPGGIIANALRMFSQGTKVAVEIAVMALDAGLIPYGVPVISVGGTSRGADTALVLKPSHARTIFDTEILEIIAKPRSPKEE